MASKKFLNPINLVNLASDPSSPVEGDIYYNTTSDVVKVYASGAWAGIAKATDLDDYQPLDGDLTSIAGLAGTSGFLVKGGANSFSLDTNTYVTSAAIANLAPIASPEFT